MANMRAWFVEEVDLGDGNKGQRQSVFEFDVETGAWVTPEGLTGAALTRWNQVMTRLQNVNNEDLRHMIHPVALRDHCLAVASGEEKPWRRGKGQNY